MLDKAEKAGVSILLPSDVVCADTFANDANTVTCSVSEIPEDMMGLDIGPETTEFYAHAIVGAKRYSGMDLWVFLKCLLLKLALKGLQWR